MADVDAAPEHFDVASVTGIPVLACPPDGLRASLLGSPNAEMRKNLSGDQPKLFTPWMAMEPRALEKDVTK